MTNDKVTKHTAPVQVALAGPEDATNALVRFISLADRRGNTASNLTGSIYDLLNEWQYEDTLHELPRAVTKFMEALLLSPELIEQLKTKMGNSYYEDLIEFLQRVPDFCSQLLATKATRAALELYLIEEDGVTNKWGADRWDGIHREYAAAAEALTLMYPDIINS